MRRCRGRRRGGGGGGDGEPAGRGRGGLRRREMDDSRGHGGAVLRPGRARQLVVTADDVTADDTIPETTRSCRRTARCAVSVEIFSTAAQLLAFSA